MAKIKLDTIVNFTTQFASMINANIPLTKVLLNLEKDILDDKFSKILQDVRKDVEKGEDLSKCLQKHPDVFDVIYVNMINAGMQSGKLNTILTQLSIYISKSAVTASKVKAALSYPKFMFMMMNAIIIFMLIKVVPMFDKMFTKSHKELPQLTQIIINMSEFFKENIFLVFIFVIILIISSKIFFKTQKGIMLIDKLKISLWGIGVLNKNLSISKFIRTLGVLTQSDIQILKAIKLSKTSASNIFIEKKLDEIIIMIEKGYGIAEAFKKVETFPDIIIQMIRSGEESGNLGDLLINSADYYDNQIDNELKSVISLINPIVTVILGLFIATLMMAIFMPILHIGNMY